MKSTGSFRLRPDPSGDARLQGSAPDRPRQAIARAIIPGPNYVEVAVVMTVLEGRVPAGRVADVERVFADGLTGMPPEIVDTFLAQDPSDPELFRLHTIWTSREALEAMRGSGVKPRGVQLFEAVGAAPELRIHRVVARGQR